MKKLLALLTIAIAFPVFAHEGQHLPYDDFIRQVEAGNVQSVTLDKFSIISGTMVAEGVTNKFWSYAKTGTANDPLLDRLLKEYEISVTMRDISQPSQTLPMLTGVMFLATPIVFIVLLIVIIRKLNQVLRNQANNPPAR